MGCSPGSICGADMEYLLTVDSGEGGSTPEASVGTPSLGRPGNIFSSAEEAI